MTSMIARLVLLFALLLMPLGMSTTAAAPAHHQVNAEMAMGHCPDQAPSGHPKAGFAECTMACAAALPAVDIAAQGPLLIVCEPPSPVAASRLHGLHPEMDPPPPKHS